MTLALALGFLGRNWRLALAVVAALAAAALLAWERHQGVIAERDRWEKRAAAAEKKAADLSDALSRKAQTAGEQASASQDHIKAHTGAIIARIPTDVPPGSPADVRLGAGWVLNYSAALGLPEDARLTALPADQPVLSAADALAGIDANSGVCLAYRDAYERVVKLYDDTRAEVNGFKP